MRSLNLLVIVVIMTMSQYGHSKLPGYLESQIDPETEYPILGKGRHVSLSIDPETDERPVPGFPTRPIFTQTDDGPLPPIIIDPVSFAESYGNQDPNKPPVKGVIHLRIQVLATLGMKEKVIPPWAGVVGYDGYPGQPIDLPKEEIAVDPFGVGPAKDDWTLPRTIELAVDPMGVGPAKDWWEKGLLGIAAQMVLDQADSLQISVNGKIGTDTLLQFAEMVLQAEEDGRGVTLVEQNPKSAAILFSTAQTIQTL